MSMHYRLAWLASVSLVFLAATAPVDASEFQERMAAWQGGAPAAGPAEPAPNSAAPPATAPRRMNYTPRTSAGGLDSPHGYHPPDSFNGSRAAHAHCPTCGPHGHQAGWAESPMHEHYGPQYGDQSYGPQYEDYGGHASCGGCGGCSGCGDCGSYGCNTMVWARFDVLLWWREGRGFPPLVTTDPVTEPSTTAGILPNAEILFGNDVAGTDVAAGGRFDIGTWFDPRQCYGIGWRFWGLGRDGMDFTINSLENPVLAIPFVDAGADVNDAFLVAYPGLRTGGIDISANSQVLGNDVYGRFLLCRDCNSRFDFITGYHFSRINDDLSIRSRNTITEVGGSIPLGTETTIQDRFSARNEFHGGILGLMWERDCGCLTTQVMARMSIGNMHETSIISGTTNIAVPNLAPVTTAGGLFTADSNIGTRERNEFTAVTEIGLNLGYRVDTCTELTLGYTFLYWNDVIRPEDAINTSVGGTGPNAQPRFRFQHADYWVQGINLGLVRKF